MATIMVNIPETNDINWVELQKKISSYASYLVLNVKRHKTSTKSVTEKKQKLSNIYGILNLSEETYETLRDKAISKKYGL